MPLVRRPSNPVPGASLDAHADRLRDGDVAARWSAARSLTTPGDVPALSGALRVETEPRVREAILTSLARIGTAACAQAVIPHIRSDDASVRTGALDALMAMPQAVGAGLRGLLVDRDADVRLLACELVRAMPEPGAVDLLCDLLDRETEANVCAAAIEVLAEVGGPETLPALARCSERFPGQPFLAFSIKVAAERIGSQSVGPLG